MEPGKLSCVTSCFGCLRAGTNRQARPLSTHNRSRPGQKKRFDAGKKVKGIKRHLWVDLLGFPLHLVVHDAGIQDRDGTRILLNDIKKKHRRLQLFRAGYRGPIMDALANQEKLKIEIVKRGEEKAFKLLPKHWIVERSFAWLEPARRLAKHYENEEVATDSLFSERKNRHLIYSRASV